MTVTRISDVVVPEVFDDYFLTQTTVQTAVIRSGAAVMSEKINADLAAGGLTFNAPSFNDLVKDKANIMTDQPYDNGGPNDAVPDNIGSKTEIVVRMNRHKSWGTNQLAAQLAGAKPLSAIGQRSGYWWARERQENFISVWNGIFANNALATDAFHVQDDMLHDAADDGVGGDLPFTDGVTNFTGANFNAAKLTMGDSMEALSLLMVHPVVYTTMKNRNLIEFVPESVNEAATLVPMYLGSRVIMDNAMPNAGGFFDSWLFGPGSTLMGAAPFAGLPSEVQRNPEAGNGAGEEILHTRVNWATHPVGHAFIGNTAGPADTGAAGMFGNANSWQRVYVERNQIQAARLRTREF